MKEGEKGRKQKLSFRFIPTRRGIENAKKKATKLKKLKKYHYGIISSQNSLEKAKNERKYKLSFRSVPTGRIIENSKKKAKKLKKKLKNTIMVSFQAKIVSKISRK